MAEAEELATDVVIHIDRLITSTFGVSYPVQVARPPAPPPLLASLFGGRRRPVLRHAIPATDGTRLWLPRGPGMAAAAPAMNQYRTMALQQAMRAERGSAGRLANHATPLHRDVYLLVEAFAADAALLGKLPDVAAGINEARRAALASRPLMSAFPRHLRPLETLVRILLRCDCREPVDPTLRSASPVESGLVAKRLVESMMPRGLAARIKTESPLLKDNWTGELLPPPTGPRLTPPGVP